MRQSFHIFTSSPRFAWVAVALVLLAFGVGSARRVPAASGPAVVCTGSSAASDADMTRLSTSHYQANPAHGTSTAVTVAATVLATNYQFDADHNLLTQNDTVFITAGQSVLFQWVAGIHTTTDGIPGDPGAGGIWDAPLDALNPQQVVTFLTPGTYPYHCYFHGALFGMTGTIVVNPAPTPTTSSTWGRIKARYR